MRKPLYLLAGAAMAAAYAANLPAADAPSIFAQQCAMCHGQDGSGVPQLAPSLKGSEFLAKATDEEVIATIRHGRAGPEKRYKDFPSVMPPFPNLSDEEVTALAAYVKRLQQ